MPDILERTVGDLTTRIDRNGCRNSGYYIDEAPDAFFLETDNPVTFKDPDKETREALLPAFACEACITEGISVFGGDGNRLVP